MINKNISFLQITQLCTTSIFRVMNGNVMKWFLFIGLSFIWGSSFILMKEGLEGLNAFQVASLRIVASGLVLLPLAIKSIKLIPANKLLPVFLSGTMGSLLPAYLFCIAEQGIDSSMAGALNSLTPVFVIITGALFFNNKASKQKVIGVFVAFSGCVLLFSCCRFCCFRVCGAAVVVIVIDIDNVIVIDIVIVIFIQYFKFYH